MNYMFTEEEYETAVKLFREHGAVSISKAQRAMRIGYIKADAIVKAMIERGIAFTRYDGVVVMKAVVR